MLLIYHLLLSGYMIRRHIDSTQLNIVAIGDEYLIAKQYFNRKVKPKN